jgi:hypothetical protein
VQLRRSNAQGSVCFYEDPNKCWNAASWCCPNLPALTCCHLTPAGPPKFSRSISIQFPSGMNSESIVYDNPDCGIFLVTDTTPYRCFPGLNNHNFFGGKWVGPLPATQTELGSEKPCTKSVSVSLLRYTFITEDQRQAHWVLNLTSITETDWNGPSIDLPAEEQVKWFKSRGANLMVEDDQTTAALD